ncbi:FAD:protein FMN transferase [Mucilaginibacter myungsuensis]|uniref:FAD:protein FMN transferase n=1 Tax=Mucilaginibacter myungsuensis TaxID=649104 RepID=A0A929PWY7_9SPHI|nr:FAD:protein FMN transferase [Mucilaginibacter myungsuensis]MBE9661672.1 FAD:protein FMN transferase [Mucilaginibacter myungsuensis]MDN3597816.1 FAD:protein FMN transferase [Mucilaginibacter myungsuensis]
MQVVKSLNNSFVHKQKVNAMGAWFEISVLTGDTEIAEQRVKSAVAEIKRVDKLLTSLGTDSIANQINYNAGIAPVKINGELYRLIERSLLIAELTQGIFDITYGTTASYVNVELNAAHNTVFLKEKGMGIYFGGIAKGYAADRAKYILQLNGIDSGVIRTEGSVVAWGLQTDGSQWTIGEADALQEQMPYAGHNISNMAVASSVKAEMLAGSDISNICIMSTSAELSSAMIAPLAKLGIQKGRQMVDALQQLACVFVDQQGKMHPSKYMAALN